jgi:lipopolysaccharide export system protein LptA
MVLVATLVQQPARATGDTTGGRPCVVEVDSIGGKYREVTVGPSEKNYFAGGGVLAHCRGTGSVLSADSVALFAGVGRFDMIGQKNLVHIRDTAVTLDATNASYFMRQERLEAHKNVVAVNRNTGSVLRGPNLTYYRAAKGIRDTLEMYASGRPTIDYRSGADSGEPYVIVADRVRFKGNDRVWGGGAVTIDRSDFAARGDSMHLDQTAGFAVLVGKPRVEGKGGQAYALTGTRIELELAGREVRRVKALGHGVATGADWRLTADTIHLALERRKLQQAFAWSAGDSSRALAVSTLHTIDADSLALDLPDEVLTDARAFRRAFSTSKQDTSAKGELNWIAGDTLTAHWVQLPDSTGQAKSKLQQIIAYSSARSFTHLRNENDSTTGPSLNYSRGRKIDIALTGDRVDRVIVSGDADGLHLEPLPPPVKDSTKADTTKKAGTNPGAMPRGKPERR